MKKHFLKLYIALSILVIPFIIHAQAPTIGLQLSQHNVSPGYTLFSPDASFSVYLINNCGEKIHEWLFNERPGATCYLLENGTLLRAGRDSLQIRDWNNNVLWTYATTANGLQQHHDIEPLPNGNILCLIRYIVSDSVLIAEGRDPSNLAITFKLEKIVELQAVGSDSANIVWEWNFIDHVIQDFDNSKPHFGVVADHPELCDLNFDNGEDNDYIHFNAIDYNADLNQIMITARHLSEIYIIDHSTTTAEASGHSEGLYNQGGDFLWRWGNPQVYKQGGGQHQKLHLPHDGKWVEPTYLDQGKITVFNNGGDGTGSFSSIHIITPVIVDSVYTKDSDKFKPLDYEWSWHGSIMGITVEQNRKSGTHSLPNGNFMICETLSGRVSEITKSGDNLWTYTNPVGEIIYDQFDKPLTNGIFRGEKYPPSYAGFAGQNLTPMGIIEDQNTVSDSCIATVSIDEQDIEELFIVNPVEYGNIQFSRDISVKAITITDIRGRIVFKNGVFNGNNIRLSLPPSIYFIRLHFDQRIETRKIIVQ